MKRTAFFLLLIGVAFAGVLPAQGFNAEPVFHVGLLPDRQPLVAGEQYRLAVRVGIDAGWHINSNAPGDDFAVPTTLKWDLPDGWSEPTVAFPMAEHLKFEFSPNPLAVWQGTVVLVASATVPPGAAGPATLGVIVTAQACNDSQCLPPLPVEAKLTTTIASAGTSSTAANAGLFSPSSKTSQPVASAARSAPSKAPQGAASRLMGLSLPWQLVIVFLAGLALNLTPCVYPLIPITIGFFTQEAKEHQGGTFGLALVYVLGMSVTYSVLGVAAALTGQLFGAALQSPIVIGVIVAVLLALALSMFGVWELRVPGWATRASGGRTGYPGALVMGLLVGFVAAPCIGPFVLGLLTYVGRTGNPLLGFVLFFTLAIGLGIPYLLLGTFSGALNKMPASGAWMVGVRNIFGVVLIALAVYFLKPVLPVNTAAWAMALTLILGALYILVIARTGHEQPTIDRVMRLLAAVMLVTGVLQVPGARSSAQPEKLTWQPFDAATVEQAVAAGRPVIVDFFADWCAPCRELDENTFSDPRVAARLASYDRFKVDLTRSTGPNRKLAEKYGVRGVPTVILYRGGREVARLTGFESPDRFLGRLK